MVKRLLVSCALSAIVFSQVGVVPALVVWAVFGLAWTLQAVRA